MVTRIGHIALRVPDLDAAVDFQREVIGMIETERTGPGFRKMSEAAHLKSFRLHRFGEDFAVEGYLRDPYLD